MAKHFTRKGQTHEVTQTIVARPGWPVSAVPAQSQVPGRNVVNRVDVLHPFKRLL